MRKVTQQVKENTQEQQKTRIDAQVYKIIHGAFESKSEAITAAGEARKKGFIVSLIIEDGKYKLLYVWCRSNWYYLIYCIIIIKWKKLCISYRIGTCRPLLLNLME